MTPASLADVKLRPWLHVGTIFRVSGRGRLALIVELSVHDESIHKTLTRVLEGSRQPPNHVKAVTLPQPHCAHVARHDKIELHGSKACTARLCEGMLEQCCPNSTDGAGKPAVTNVRTAASLVWGQKVRAHNFSFSCGRHKRAVRASTPVVESIQLRHVPWHAVRLASRKDGLQDAPQGCHVSFGFAVRLADDDVGRAHPQVLLLVAGGRDLAGFLFLELAIINKAKSRCSEIDLELTIINQAG